MSRRRTLIAVIVAGGIGGCAIQPLPQDVAPLGTVAIVTQIRCEVRGALFDRVKNALVLFDEDPTLDTDLRHQKITYSQFLGKVKNKDLREIFEQYAGATVAYDFSLDMTETDNITGGATLTRPLSRGANTVGFMLDSSHKRENTRTFTIDDTFVQLMTDVPNSYCLNTTDEPNYNYPITGKTRLEDTVLTFLNLNQSGNLGMKAGGPKTPTMTDDLQFTTMNSGSISPGFAVMPIARVLTLSGVTGKLEGIRNDIHRVTVALALPEKGKKVTAKTLQETSINARTALANASANRFEIYVQKISNGLTSSVSNSLLGTVLR